MGDVRLYEGDCREVLARLPDNSIDAIVTDPPYELGFMGKRWDASGIAYDVEVWRQCLRVLRPGGHLLAFGGTRTYHRMACAIEDAGFEIRDQLQWLYGSGFPKGQDVAKAMGRAAQRWQGWNTTLKPANEPICLARKPLAEPTVAANVLKWGTGALNIDGCRVGVADWPSHAPRTPNAIYGGGKGTNLTPSEPHEQGRWPANVLHDGSAEVLELFPDSEGGARPAHRNVSHFGQGSGTHDGERLRYDSGSAARFFYCAKASRREREMGLEGWEAQPAGCLSGREDGSLGAKTAPRANTHPTVKPLALMRYLVRLVTPPGGVVLDPFAGSGTTGMAAVREGFGFVGVEIEETYVQIARARIARMAEKAADLALEGR